MRKFVFFIIMLFEIMLGYGQVIEVIGDVQGNWNADTVKVMGDIRVKDGDVLTIDPGVVVEFDRYYSFTVDGRLMAEGAPGDSIIFTIRDTTNFSDFTSNRGAWNGIVFQNPGQQDSSLLSYCRFEFSKAFGPDSLEWFGGFIRIFNQGNIRISHCMFDKAFAYRWGGGVFADGSDIIIRHSVFAQCHSGDTIPPYGYGGGLCTRYSNPVVEYCIFRNNTATGVGGGASFEYSDPRVTYNIFEKNLGGLGGGVCFLRSQPVNVVSNNLIINNEAVFFGGGIASLKAQNRFVNNTIAGNTAIYGGGIYANDSAYPAHYNSIVWGNHGSVGNSVYIFDVTSAPDFYFSDVEGGKEGFEGSGGGQGYSGNYENNIDADPLFLSSGEYPYTLRDISPCVDSGITDTTGLHIPVTDLAGKLRIYNHRIDMGAYEYQPCIGFPEFYPPQVKILSAYPNPFHDALEINIQIQSGGFINLLITDHAGKRVQSLFRGYADAGNHTFIWSSETALPAGNYWLILQHKDLFQSLKIIHIK